MSSSANARNGTETSRRPVTTTTTAKLRVPSSRVMGKDRSLSSSEVIPEDSASNGPHRRSASGTSKVNGGSGRAFEGRQTERVHLATRDNVQIRTRSPVRMFEMNGLGVMDTAELEPNQGGRAAEQPQTLAKKEKAAQCELPGK